MLSSIVKKKKPIKKNSQSSKIFDLFKCTRVQEHVKLYYTGFDSVSDKNSCCLLHVSMQTSSLDTRGGPFLKTRN